VTGSPRILVIAPRLEVGGTELHLIRVLPELRRRGIDVSVFVLARGGKLEARLAASGVPLSGYAGGAPRPFGSLGAVLALRRELRRLRPDVVHFFLPEPYLIGMVASVGIRPLTRVMSRRSLAVYQRKHPALGLLERWLHRFTDRLLGNSTAVVEELVAECGKREKVEMIHNGVELPPSISGDSRQAVRRELGIAPDAFVMVVSANFIAYKGHSGLFDALGASKDRLNGAWRLVLIGHDLGMAAALRRKATELGIADNIVWLEDRSDAQSPLAAADIAVLPSHQEGFSNSLIEMMGCGLPVIATRVGGNTDAIVDGESGLLVAVGDVPALAAAILALHDNRPRRLAMGGAARARVAENFTLEVCVDRYVDVYTRLQNKSQRA
jgi:glycosyltransferase involved in cell wall biosynthesis